MSLRFDTLKQVNIWVKPSEGLYMSWLLLLDPWGHCLPISSV